MALRNNYFVWFYVQQNLSGEILQTIAAEINLTETAFIEHLADDSSFDKSKSFISLSRLCIIQLPTKMLLW